MRLVEISIGKKGRTDFGTDQRSNGNRFLLHDRQKVKIGVKEGSLDFNFIKIEENEDNNGYLHEVELLCDGEDILMPSLNEYSFNPVIFKDETSPRKDMLFVTVDTEIFTQLRYYTNCEIISTFQSRVNGEIGCIVLVPQVTSADDDPYFVIHGVNKDGRFASYTYDSKEVKLNYSEKFKTSQLLKLKNIYKKYNDHALTYKYSGHVVPAYILCKEKDVDEMAKRYDAEIRKYAVLQRFNVKDKLNIITIKDDIDCNKSVNDVLVAAIISGAFNRTKAVILGDDIELPYEIAKKEGLLYLFKFEKTKEGKYRLKQTGTRRDKED